MAPSKTKTMKNKNAGPKSSKGARDSATGGISKSKGKPKGPVISQQVKEKNRALLLRKPKKKTYSEEELGIPKLNMITPIGVMKPKGKKKGKVFVDDKVRLDTTYHAPVCVELYADMCRNYRKGSIPSWPWSRRRKKDRLNPR